MCDNLICLVAIRHCSFGKSDCVYKGLTKLAGWILDYLVAANLTHWIASPDLNWAWHSSAPACFKILSFLILIYISSSYLFGYGLFKYFVITFGPPPRATTGQTPGRWHCSVRQTKTKLGLCQTLAKVGLLEECDLTSGQNTNVCSRPWWIWYRGQQIILKSQNTKHWSSI